MIPMIAAPLMKWAGENALKIGVAVAAVTFVTGSLWYIKHEAYKDGFNAATKESKQAYDDEVKRIKKETSELLALNALENAKVQERNEQKLKEVIDAKSKTIKDINNKYDRALNDWVQYDTGKRSAKESSSNRVPTKANGTAINDTRNQKSESNGLDRETKAAILQNGVDMQKLVAQCNAYLDLTENVIQVIND